MRSSEVNYNPERRELQVVSPRFTELDSIRGLAALWVFAYHVWQFGGSPAFNVSFAGHTWDLLLPMQHGPAGVDLFMVLSGFCLFWPLSSASPAPWNWKEYARRRAWRILPAYYGAIAYSILLPGTLVAFVRMLGWVAKPQLVPDLWQILTHLFFIHTLFRETWDGITGAFWSMGLEAQFYVVFPGLVWAWRRYGVWMIVGAAVASLVFRICVGQLMSGGDPITHFLVSITFLGRWMQFASGMAAALWLRFLLDRKAASVLSEGLVLCATGLFVSLMAFHSSVATKVFMPWRDMLLALGYGLLLTGVCLLPPAFKSVLLKGPLLWTGRISYSFFLTHQPTSWYLMELLRKKFGITGLSQVLVGYSLGLVVTLLFAACFYQLLERPFLGSAKRKRESFSMSPVGNLKRVESDL